MTKCTIWTFIYGTACTVSLLTTMACVAVVR